MGARHTALTALMACRREGGWSNGVLKEYIRRDRLDAREAALATRLCYGVLQNRLKLDHYLGQLLTGSLNKLHPGVRDVLHLGLYQLLEMDKIPQSAAVNESVALAKKVFGRQPGAAGLVNAVLRKAAADPGALIPPQTLSQRYSHPQKLLDLLQSYVGEQRMEAMLKANNDTPPTVIQVNTLKTDTASLQKRLEEAGVRVQPHGWMSDCLVLSGTGNLEALPEFQQGLFYVQDAAARLSVMCAQLMPGDLQVLDCCAAPGGKSFAAAIAMGGQGSVLSRDLYDHKAELIRAGARRLGLTNISADRRDATAEAPQWREKMDVILCDVPCSGYGIIRKKPDIRYKDPDTMNDLPQLQLRILSRQAEFLKPGGVLIYSTCTLVRKENEGVVKAFLKTHPEFFTEPLPLPEIFGENTTGMLALVPGQYDTDGFFICRLRRKA